MRGYPIDTTDDDTLLILELVPIGAWSELHRCLNSKTRTIELTG